MEREAEPYRPSLRDRVSRLTPWPVRTAVDLVRGGDHRHRGRARLAALRHGRYWRHERRRLRAIHGGRPLVAVALVEHMGDIVAAEPILRHLRAETPEAYLVAVVRDSFTPLVAHHPAVDAVYPVGCLSEWIWLKDAAPFDRVVDLHIHDRLCVKCNVPIDRRRDGDPRINLRTYYAEGNLLHAFCRSARLPVLDDTPRLHLPDEARDRVDRLRLPARFVVVHAKSNESLRDWHDDGWNRVASELSDARVPVVEVGLDPVIRSRGAGYRDLTGRLGLLETAEVIRRAAVFVGIDSGPAHIANAVGTRGVVILGRYWDYARYMPYSGAYASGGRATVLYADGPASSTPVDKVVEAVTDALRQELGSAALGPGVAT